MAEVLVRTSERSSFKRCRWAWNIAYVRNLKPYTPSPALRFGNLIHQALAVYYCEGRKRGPHPRPVFEELYEQELAEQREFGFRDEDGHWHNALEMGVDMLNAYVDHYGSDSQYEVIATEQPFQVKVYNPKTGKYMFTYVGVVDGVWRDLASRKKSLVIPDHKTATSVRTDNLVLDEQAGAYWTFGLDWLYQQGILKSDDTIQGILFNYLRKATKDQRPQNDEGKYLNKDGSVSQRQPSPLFHREPSLRTEYEREKVRRRAMNDFREMRMARKGRLAIVKNPGPQHMPNCAGCPARDVCELEEAGANWEELLGATFVEWDPYAEHEIYDGR